MGMYSRIGLKIWQHQENRPANTYETKRIIQALYDDKEVNANQEAEYAFDLNGISSNEVKWYDVESNIAKFSEKHPDYSFTIRIKSEEQEFENERAYFRTFFHGQSVLSASYFWDLGYVDYDLDEFFNSAFTLFDTPEKLKSQIIHTIDDSFLTIYIPTTQKNESKRIARILNYQAMFQLQESNFHIEDIHHYLPQNAPISNGIQIKYYLPTLESKKVSPDEAIEFIIDLSNKYLIGVLH